MKEKVTIISFVFLVLFLIQGTHFLLMLGVAELGLLSYTEEGIFLLLAFQVLLFLGILLSSKWFGVRPRLNFKSFSFRIIVLGLILSLALFFLQSAIEWEFLILLANSKLKFFEVSTGYLDDSYVLVGFVLSILTAPILEEILYRGIIFSKLKEYFNLRISIILASFFFAIMHLNLEGFFAYFFVGIVLTYLYSITKLLWLNILVHFIYNILAGILRTSIHTTSETTFYMGVLTMVLSILYLIWVLPRFEKYTNI